MTLEISSPMILDAIFENYRFHKSRKIFQDEKRSELYQCFEMTNKRVKNQVDLETIPRTQIVIDLT